MARGTERPTKFMKKIITKILHSIRRVLTALRNNYLPIISSPPLSLSLYISDVCKRGNKKVL